MKQVIAEGGKVEVLDVPRPVCKPNEVMVRTAFSLISTGTESWTIEATDPISAQDLVGSSARLQKAVSLAADVRRKEGLGGLMDYIKAVRRPRVALGYSLSGEVVEVGREDLDISVGDKVACAGEGKACHAEFACVPRNLLTKVPENVNLQSAAFVALGAIAVHAFRQSSARVGETIAVIGTGLVGNLVIQVCKAAGCRVIAIDLLEARLELARKSGADLVILSSDENLLDHAQYFTKGRGVDVAIICASTSNSEPVNLASSIVRDRGLVLIVGRVGMDFDRKPCYQKELSIRMSRSLGPGRYDLAYEEKGIDYPLGYVRWTLNRNMESFIELLAQGSIKVGELVEAKYPIERAADAYERVGSGDKVAVLLEYGREEVQSSSPTSMPLKPRTTSGKINIALIGPGNFAKETLLPILRKDRSLSLRWVVAANPIHALDIGQRYHFEKYGTSLDDVLKDDSVDLVVISTPNNLHFPMAVQAAKAGKVVFVEKPLCIKEADLQEFERAKDEIGSRLIVGFNRRYSSYVLKMKRRLQKMDKPFMVSYRVNADLVPLSRWSEDPEVGGGRVIHECSHFFDFFNFLLESRCVSASVVSTSITGSTTVSHDNFVATLKYSEGSVCSLVYSSLGNRTAERERIEVFGQGTVMVLDDFKSLTTFLTSGQDIVESNGPDKGHRGEFLELVKLLKGQEHNLVTFDETVAAMQDTFMIDALLRQANPHSSISGH